MHAHDSDCHPKLDVPSSNSNSLLQLEVAGWAAAHRDTAAGPSRCRRIQVRGTAVVAVPPRDRDWQTGRGRHLPRHINRYYCDAYWLFKVMIIASQ
jgi:hypothetical protein